MWVRPYRTSDGEWVEGHWRDAPDGGSVLSDDYRGHVADQLQQHAAALQREAQIRYVLTSYAQALAG